LGGERSFAGRFQDGEHARQQTKPGRQQLDRAVT